MAKKAKAENAEETAKADGAKDNAKKRVLLVDDDPEIIDALRYALNAK